MPTFLTLCDCGKNLNRTDGIDRFILGWKVQGNSQMHHVYHIILLRSTFNLIRTEYPVQVNISWKTVNKQTCTHAERLFFLILTNNQTSTIDHCVAWCSNDLILPNDMFWYSATRPYSFYFSDCIPSVLVMTFWLFKIYICKMRVFLSNWSN